MASPAQLAMTQSPARVRIALSTIGFSAVVAQIVLMRELLIASYGNELSLGIMLSVWLAWTAVGSHFLGQLFRTASPLRVLAFLLTTAALAIFVAIFVVRSSRSYWNASAGEALGPVPIFLTTVLALAVYCPLSGWLFSAGSRCYAEYVHGNMSQASSSVYLLEAIGSAIGGLLASILFVRMFDSVQIATFIAGVNLLAAIFLRTPNRMKRLIIALIILGAGVTVMLVSSELEFRTLAQSWPGFHVVAERNSPYGNLAVVETEGNRSLIQNGMILFTVPDQAAAEEAVHFPLLEHPVPRSVLLIGGGLNGSVAEILKYPTVERLDYVELDPSVVRIARDYFPRVWSSLAADSRVHMHEFDGRLFLNSAGLRFDVIVLNLPEPLTAQINRFYTEQFFQEVAGHLTRGGIFGFQMHASEEYLSPQMRDFLRCLNATLRRVFKEGITIPGETVHFIATQQAGLLTTDPQVLLHRLDERGVRTTFLREYYLPFRMTPERVEGLEKQLQPAPSARVNGDFVPVAYFFNVELWSTQFNTRYREAFQVAAGIRFREVIGAVVVLVVIATMAFPKLRGRSRNRFTAGYSVSMMGLSLMAVEILLLLGFQAVYGYVFNELAVIIAGFMVGMAIGSWFAIRRGFRDEHDSSLRFLLLSQIAVVLLLLLTTPFVAGMQRLSEAGLPSIFLHAGFLAVAVLCGMTGGYQFPIAMRIFSSYERGEPVWPGTLYGLDLLGACIGAVLISIWLLPVFGFYKTAVVVALANVGPLLVSSRALKEIETR